MIKLDQYQLDAIRKLRTGSILCGGVGSGKSRTALAYYYTKQGGVLDPMLPMPFETAKDLYIITTARKRDTLEWEEETLPFGLNKEDDENRNYICNYYVDSWNNIKKYRDVKGAFFIFDEQRVVSNGTWSRSFLHIAKNNDWILLSATPGDTWHYFVGWALDRDTEDGLTDNLVIDTSEMKNIKESMEVYYGNYYYRKMFFLGYMKAFWICLKWGLLKPFRLIGKRI